MGKTLEERLEWVEHKARLQEGFAEVVDIDLSKLVNTAKSMQQTLAGHTKILERQDQTLQSHGRMLHRLDQKTTGLDEKVTILDDKVSGVDEKITRIEVRMEERFVGLDEKIDGVLALLTAPNPVAVPRARIASDGS